MSKTNTTENQELLEYSVVYTERSLNHMSKTFQKVMCDLSALLKEAYQADTVVLVPGGGTFAMEAVARQFALDQSCLVIRNGWFSYRWTQILEMAQLPSSTTVCKAAQIADGDQAPFRPAPIEDVVATILEVKPNVVFAPHVETSAGVMLPDDYIAQVAQAVHQVGGLFVLDCIASGAMWVDMKSLGVDVLISAPQKGWTSTPCCGFVMMSELATERACARQSNSFACDLKKWLDIMRAYEGGGHAYHATMPTDGLVQARDTIQEIKAFGFDKAKQAQAELGQQVRALLADRGFASVAAPGFEAPGVVVAYTNQHPEPIVGQFIKEGMQIAAGVPLQCDEPVGFSTFRIGLFGLDKLKDVAAAAGTFKAKLDKIR